jgi:hypothetical protein
MPRPLIETLLYQESAAAVPDHELGKQGLQGHSSPQRSRGPRGQILLATLLSFLLYGDPFCLMCVEIKYFASVMDREESLFRTRP